MDEMRIGDFSKPLADPKGTPKAPERTEEPRTLPPAEGPGVDKLNTAEVRLKEKAEETEAALKPKMSYEAQLKAHGISMEEAAKIVDDVLFKGYYSEEIKVSSRVSVVFRTRQARDTERTFTYLEIHKPVYEQHYNEAISKHSLAAALERLGEDRFSFPDRKEGSDKIEDAFQERWAYVNALPDPVLRLLFLKMGKFDEKVRVVLQEGAIENF
jgi:hypothetical protein